MTRLLSRDVCGDLGCGMVTVHTYWNGMVMGKGLNKHSELMQDNVLYPNARGHEFFTHALIQKLERRVSERKRREEKRRSTITGAVQENLLTAPLVCAECKYGA
jgi:hypothetical protein